MSDEPGVAGKQGDLVARLRAVIGAKDEQIAALTASLEAALARLDAAAAEAAASRDRERRLELRVAELERRLSMDSTDSGTPSSKERIGAKEARRTRQESERERRKDRKRGGQPGHQGKGLPRDPDPGERKTADPPAECRSCKAGLDGAEAAEPRWAQVIDAEIIRKVTEWLLPGLACRCCGTVTFADPPPGAHAGAVSYGLVLNAAAVLLSCYGNVPPERAAQVMGMLLGIPVSAGWVDKAAARVAARLGKAGFDDAMIAALAAEDVLAADETPVNVLDKTVPAVAVPQEWEEADPEEKEGKAAAGAPHVLITRTPDGRLTFLQAIGSRRKDAIAAGLPGPVHRLPDHRRLHRLPAPPVPAGRHPAMRSARDPKMPRRHETRPRQPAELGRRHHHHPPRRSSGRRGRPRARGHRPGPAGTRWPAGTLRHGRRLRDDA